MKVIQKAVKDTYIVCWSPNPIAYMSLLRNSTSMEHYEQFPTILPHSYKIHVFCCSTTKLHLLEFLSIFYLIISIVPVIRISVVTLEPFIIRLQVGRSLFFRTPMRDLLVILDLNLLQFFFVLELICLCSFKFPLYTFYFFIEILGNPEIYYN
jgi:hypothetical protein